MRVQRLVVTKELILSAIGAAGTKERPLRSVWVEGLPEGYKPLDVHFDPSNATFSILIEHDSFGEILPGMTIPVANAIVNVRYEQPGSAFVSDFVEGAK